MTTESTPLFTTETFLFPYTYKFPGQASDEKILFVTRENNIMLFVRRIGVVITALTAIGLSWWLAGFLVTFLGDGAAFISMSMTVLGLLIAVIGWWWVSTLWQKSIVLVTTNRLVKYIYTTPFNRHVLSLPLEMIVDTGSYTKGFIQALFKLGTFTARSSASSSGVATDDADRINKKYFYIENVAVAEDLQHYVNKVLYAYRHHREHLPTFRPFIPELKGDARKQFMEQYPDYWS